MPRPICSSSRCDDGDVTAMDPSGNKAQATQKVFVFDPDEVEVLAPQWWVRREAVVDGAALVPYLSILPWPEGGTSLIWWAWCLMADELPGPASLFGLSDGAIVGTRSGGSNLAMGGALASLGSGGLVDSFPPRGSKCASAAAGAGLGATAGWRDWRAPRLASPVRGIRRPCDHRVAGEHRRDIGRARVVRGRIASRRPQHGRLVALERGLEEEVQWTGPLVPGYAYEGLAATVAAAGPMAPGDDLDSFLAREVNGGGS